MDRGRWEDERERRHSFGREDREGRRSPPRRDERDRADSRSNAQKRDRDFGSPEDRRGREDSPPRKRTKTDEGDSNYRRGRDSPERGPVHLSRRFLSENFFSLKEFARSLNIDLKWPDLPTMYEEYKNAYDEDRAREMHILWRHENWYRDLYLPSNVERQFLKRSERAREQASLFFSALSSGDLNVDLNADHNIHILPSELKKIAEQQSRPSADPAQPENTTPTVKTDLSDANARDDRVDSHRMGGDGQESAATVSAVETDYDKTRAQREASTTLFLKNIPKWVLREQLEAGIAAVSPFKRLILSGPNPARDFLRLAWVEYSTHEEAKIALAGLHGQKISNPGSMSYDIQATFHISRSFDDTFGRTEVVSAAFSDADRMLIDLAQSRRLMETLDQEKGIEGNPLSDPVQNGATQLQQTLDRIIEYLRKVHLFDYYRGQEYLAEDRLILHAGQNVLRGVSGLAPKHIGNPTALCDERVNKRIDRRLSIADFSPNSQLERVVSEKYSQHSTQLEAEKSRCDKCQKLFKGPDFIKKHLINRHADIFSVHIEEEQFFQNYSADPSKLTASSFSLARSERDGPKPRKEKSQDRQGGGRAGSSKRAPKEERTTPISSPSPSQIPVSPPVGRASISYSDLDAIPAKKVGLVYRRRQPAPNGVDPQ